MTITENRPTDLERLRQLTLERVEEASRASKQVSEVTDEPSAERAAAALGRIVAARKFADVQRREASRPHREILATIMDEWREMLAPLKAAEDVLKAEILRYRQEAQRRVQAERQRLERNAARRQAREDRQAREEGREAVKHAAPELAGPPATRRTGEAAVTARKIWRFEIVDEAAVPRELCVVAEGRIRKAISDGARDIPGVRIYQDEIASVRPNG